MTSATSLRLSPTTTVLVEVVRRAAGEPESGSLTEALAAFEARSGASGAGWEGLLAAARLHGIEGTLCGVVLKDGAALLPDDVADEWRGVRRGIAARSLLMSRQALAVIDLLRHAGVRAMLYKGPALSEPVYGDVAARSWCDIDLVVAADDVPAVGRALEGAGFAPDARGVALGAEVMQAEQEMGYKHTDSGLALDLHWRVGLRFAGGALDGADLLERAVPGEVLERPVLVPSRADTALLAALHAAAHNWPQLDAVLTMSLALDAVRDAGAGTEGALLAVARSTGCARRLRIGVLLARAIGGVVAPRALVEDAVADRRARRLAAAVGADLLWLAESRAVGRPSAERRSHAREVLWQLGALDSAAAAFRHGWIRLLRPGARDTGIERVADATEPASADADGPRAGVRAGAHEDRFGGGAVETLRATIRRQRRIWR